MMRHLAHFLLLFGLPAAALGVALIFAARSGAPATPQGMERVDPFAAAVGLRVSAPLRARAVRGRPERTREHLALGAGVIATAAAGVIHAGVTKRHFDEYWLYGVFFAASALAQLTWAGIALRHPSRLLVELAAAGNAAVIGLWIVTRTVGVPLGPGAGEVEGAGAPDVAATLYQAAAVIACLHLLRRRDRVITPPHVGALEVISAAIVLATALALSLVGHGPD